MKTNRKIRIRRWWAVLIVATIVWGCTGTQNEYSARHCFLVFDNNTHQDATLASAMTPYSGVFVTITLSSHGGAQYFNFQSNQKTSSESIFNAIDNQRTVMLGQNQGLIVGYGLLSDPPVFYAFDRECPNCFDAKRIPMRSYPLSVASTGIATCATCQRQYNLGSGGNIVAGDGGEKATRYRATTTGAYGMLNVN